MSYLDDFRAALAADGIDTTPAVEDRARPMSRADYEREWRAARAAERVEVNGRLVHPSAPHGTASAYVAYGCRCEPCTTAAVVRTEERQDRVRAHLRGHGVSGWRRGCRCVLCAAEKARTDRIRRRRATRRLVGRYQRTRITDAISAGAHPVEAAAAVGLTWNQVLGLARLDRRWASRLDKALLTGRNPDIAHGSYYSYQKHRCRCPECRAAKARYR
ncbi:hypothetical protein [Nocardia sp. NPDC051833]|uniref:hypothetical protein n=1 Tax=Nocardia sp. NPDC051833 TaxID=3155674 RepID=UPI003442208D